MGQATAPNESGDLAENELGQVFLWRCEELRRAGYGLKGALLLAANPNVDWCQNRRLPGLVWQRSGERSVSGKRPLVR